MLFIEKIFIVSLFPLFTKALKNIFEYLKLFLLKNVGLFIVYIVYLKMLAFLLFTLFTNEPRKVVNFFVYIVYEIEISHVIFEPCLQDSLFG